MSVALSKWVYWVGNSVLSIPSFTESPSGWLRSKTSRYEPSGFGVAPRAKCGLLGKVGMGKGRQYDLGQVLYELP